MGIRVGDDLRSCESEGAPGCRPPSSAPRIGISTIKTENCSRLEGPHDSAPEKPSHQNAPREPGPILTRKSFKITKVPRGRMAFEVKRRRNPQERRRPPCFRPRPPHDPRSLASGSPLPPAPLQHPQNPATPRNVFSYACQARISRIGDPITANLPTVPVTIDNSDRRCSAIMGPPTSPLAGLRPSSDQGQLGGRPNSTWLHSSYLCHISNFICKIKGVFPGPGRFPL